VEQATNCPRHGNECPDLLRVMEILNRMFEPKDVGKWLDCPHPDLGGKTSRQAINEGYASAVRTMLENALMGIPS
jgi:hypothetical protein